MYKYMNYPLDHLYTVYNIIIIQYNNNNNNNLKAYNMFPYTWQWITWIQE